MGPWVFVVVGSNPTIHNNNILLTFPMPTRRHFVKELTGGISPFDRLQKVNQLLLSTPTKPYNNIGTNISDERGLTPLQLETRFRGQIYWDLV